MGQSKRNFMCSLSGMGESKFVQVIQVTWPSLFSWWPWVNLDHFYGKVKFASLCFYIGKYTFLQENVWKSFNGRNLQQMTRVTKDLCWYKNFDPKGLFAPAPGLYTCIKAWNPKGMVSCKYLPPFKKSDESLACNYRPVSLTCVPCKLLKHIVC